MLFTAALIVIAAPLALVLLFTLKIFFSSLRKYLQIRNTVGTLFYDTGLLCLHAFITNIHTKCSCKNPDASKRIPLAGFFDTIYKRFVKKLGPLDTLLVSAQTVCFCFTVVVL